MKQWRVVLIMKNQKQTIEMLCCDQSTYKDALDEALEYQSIPPWIDTVSITISRTNKEEDDDE